MACLSRWITIAKNYKNLLIVLLVPLLFSPLLQESWHQTIRTACDPTCETDCITGEDGSFYREEVKRPFKCLFALIILATYWTAEVTPLAVTSLVPMFLFPTLGLLPAARTAQHYFKDTNFLFFGGLIVAIAIEECNLHLRIALTVMKAAGSKLHSLMAAFMGVTAFLSMWISNTATTAMMLPIAVATVKTIVGDDVDAEESSVSSQPEVDQHDGLNIVTSVNSLDDGFVVSSGSLQIPKQQGAYQSVQTNASVGQMASFQSVGETKKTGGYSAAVPKKTKPKSNENSAMLMKAMLLAVAFSANIGGIGTLIGTPVNLILQSQIETLYKDNPAGVTPGDEINFLSWMYFALPVSIVCNIGCWFWLISYYMGPSKVLRDLRAKNDNEDDMRVKRLIREKYDALGRMGYQEMVVGVHFLTLAVLWFTRSPKFIDGWHAAFEKGHVKDSTAALAICFSLFLWPQKPNFFNYLMGREYERDENNLPKPSKTILDWKSVQKRLAWDVIILLGAGFALADACQDSGLSKLLGETIGNFMDGISPRFLPFLAALMISFITGVCSNTSTASVFIPIIAALCVNMSINPLLLCIPVTMACSFAFILPIATPPNAIAFSYGYLTTTDMLKVGVLLNVLCVTICSMMLPIIGYPAYSLNEFPKWAMSAEQLNNLTDPLLQPAVNLTLP